MRFAILCLTLAACSSTMSTGGGADSSILGFTPANVDPNGLDFTAVGDLDLAGGKTWMTDLGGLLGSSNSGTYNYQLVTQPGGAMLGVFTVNSLTIDPGVLVHVEGAYPIVIVALDSIDIEGTLDAGSQFEGGWYGPGSQHDDTDAIQGAGLGGGGAGTTATAGGGGGFCGHGGTGGSAGGAGAAGGASYGSPALSPLVAGSMGGAGTLGTGGASGGAVQLIAANQITIGGTIQLGGRGGYGSGVYGAGLSQTAGGGGSGGALLVEAAAIEVSGTIAANGGGGGGDAVGADASADLVAAAGGTSSSATNTPGGDGAAGAAIDGEDGPSAADANGGGGGGAAGMMRFDTLASPATITGTLSPARTTPCVSLGTVAP
ncbi:MAG: hypothetical protein ABI467_33115 [Kofleriaceae bacterium]